VVKEMASALRCVCGYQILCEVIREGERLGFLAFFDDESVSSTRSNRLKNCPSCGQPLGLLMLSLKNRLG
jgi:hypothetical protein